MVNRMSGTKDEKRFIKYRCLLNHISTAQGRGGEIAVDSLLCQRWDYGEECLFSEWGQIKTGKQKTLGRVPDFNCPELDWYHSFGTYITLFEIDANKVYKDLADYKNGCSPQVTQMIRVFVPDAKNPQPYHVEGIVPEMTSTSPRIGTTNDIVRHPKCNLLHAIAHGGWDFQEDCNIWVYLVMTSSFCLIGSKALANWPNPRAHVYPPRLIFLNESNCDLIGSFMNLVYQSA